MNIISRIRLYLGIIPKTAAIEDKRAALIAEFNEYNEYSASKELARYKELKELVNTNEFKDKIKQIKAQKFLNTPEYIIEQKYLALKKSSSIKVYNKVKDSDALQEFLATEKSSDLAEFIELEKYVNSSEFIELKNNTPKQEFKESDSYAKFLKHKELSGFAAIKKYYKFIQSESYKTYKEVAQSSQLEEMNNLEKKIAGDDFLSVKEYMALSPKQKYEQSEECALLNEYHALDKSEKIKWFFSLSNTKKFDILKDWKITFEDAFEDKKLSKNWLTKYYYGETVVNDSYSITNDLHYVSDGNNVSINNGCAVIATKKESAEGKSWHPTFGFYNKKYNYTSGLINSAVSFRQMYGKFEAKVRIKTPTVAVHTVWLAGEKALPQVNLCKIEKNHLQVGLFWGKLNKKEIKKKTATFLSSKIASDYFIIGFEWTPEKLIWKINGLEALSISNTLLNAPMYIAFSSGLYKVTEALPELFEIDWVRCSEKNA
jgi:hypothetical protein